MVQRVCEEGESVMTKLSELIIYHVENLENLFDLAERLYKQGFRWSGVELELNNKIFLLHLFDSNEKLCLFLENGIVSWGSKEYYETYRSYIPMVTYRREEQIDVPTYEAKKAIVPQFVADWIVESKNKGCTLRQSMCYEVKADVFLYFTNNSETYARAWLDGYEIEQEKLYTVKIKKTNQFLYMVDDNYAFITYTRPDDNARMHFTEIELKTAGFVEVLNSGMFEVEEVQNGRSSGGF